MTSIRTVSITAALALSGALTFSACSAPAEEPTDSAPVSEETAESEPAETMDGGSPSAEQSEVTIGEKFKDADVGDEIEVKSAVRDFPSAENPDISADGGEIVLLEVAITPGSEFGGSVSAGNFQISWDDGADYWTDKTRMVETEMKEAGFTPFEDISRRDGGTGTGWIAFFADEKAESYTVQYNRAEAKVIGEDKTIKEFTKDIAIPAS